MTKSTSDLERFWSKVDKTDDCWLWTAATVKSGNRAKDAPYGQFWATGKVHRAHRWIFEQSVEPLVDGLTIDHLCGTTLCVRPTHLQQVTHQVNILRSDCPAAVNSRRTECSSGHEFTPENTHYRPGGQRRCRACWNSYRQKAA